MGNAQGPGLGDTCTACLSLADKNGRATHVQDVGRFADFELAVDRLVRATRAASERSDGHAKRRRTEADGSLVWQLATRHLQRRDPPPHAFGVDLLLYTPLTDAHRGGLLGCSSVFVVLDCLDMAIIGGVHQLSAALRCWSKQEARVHCGTLIATRAMLAWPHGFSVLLHAGWEIAQLHQADSALAEVLGDPAGFTLAQDLSPRARSQVEKKLKSAARSVLLYLQAHGVGLGLLAGEGTFGLVLRGDRFAAKFVLMDNEDQNDEVQAEMRTHGRLAHLVATNSTSAAMIRRVLPVWCALRLRTDRNAARAIGMLIMPRATCDLAHLLEDKKLNAPGTITVQNRLSLAADIAIGLTALHTAGVVVCDLKPTNILVDVIQSTGKPTAYRAMLTDMGMNSLVQMRATACRGTIGYVTTMRTKDGDTKRPVTHNFDWMIFAKVCFVLFASTPEEASTTDVSCGVSLMSAAQFDQHVILPLASSADATVLLAKFGGDKAGCVEDENHRHAPLLHDKDPRAIELLAWAARIVGAANESTTGEFEVGFTGQLPPGLQDFYG